MEPEIAFGRVLAELRRTKGLTQEGLGFDSGLDRTYISLLERGLRQPSLKTMLELAKALGVSPVELMSLVVDRLAVRRR